MASMPWFSNPNVKTPLTAIWSYVETGKRQSQAILCVCVWKGGGELDVLKLYPLIFVLELILGMASGVAALKESVLYAKHVVFLLVDHAAPRKDVVFLLDGSDYTRNVFPAMKDFVQRVVEKLNVMENRDRVSVVQYSRDPEAHFYLNTYTRKEDTLDAVRALRHKGGRPLNTGAALQYVRDSAFAPSSGSRRQEGVPQILILLSGATSSDNVDTPATSLKESGVLVFSIGTRNSSREVERISSDPTYAQSVSDFSELPNVQQQLLASVSTAVLEVTQTSPPVSGKTDLTILIFISSCRLVCGILIPSCPNVAEKNKPTL